MQTAQRAEVQALFMACHSAAGGQVEVVSDSQFVRDTALAVRGGLCCEGAHRDVWGALAPTLRSGLVTVRWVLAHLSVVQAAARGVAEQDRRMNALADAVASGLAAELRASAPVRCACRQDLGALRLVQLVLAKVQLAALKVAHSRGSWLRLRRAAQRAARPRRLSGGRGAGSPAADLGGAGAAC